MELVISVHFVFTMYNNFTDVHVTVLWTMTYACNRVNILKKLGDRVELVVGDIADAALVDKLAAEADAIVHTMRQKATDNFRLNPSPHLSIPFIGKLILLDKRLEYYPRFHHLSTV